MVRVTGLPLDEINPLDIRSELGTLDDREPAKNRWFVALSSVAIAAGGNASPNAREPANMNRSPNRGRLERGWTSQCWSALAHPASDKITSASFALGFAAAPAVSYQSVLLGEPSLKLLTWSIV